MHKNRVFALVTIMLLVASMICAVAEEDNPVFDKNFGTHQLNVWFFALDGNSHTGESILIRTPSGHWLIIDSGTPEVGMQINEKLQLLGVDTLDAIFVTHMHIDHIGGFPTILAKHDVKAIYSCPFTDYQTTPVATLKAKASDKQLQLTKVYGGDTMTYGEVKIQILWPIEEPVPFSESSITGAFLNDSSIVFKLTYRDISMLFTGDITREAEEQLIDLYGDQLHVDVLKVPHHGSSDASSRAFVEAVSAENSVICSYAINDLNVYDRYKKYGNRPWITSLDGTVLCTTDGENILFIAEKTRKGMLK